MSVGTALPVTHRSPGLAGRASYFTPEVYSKHGGAAVAVFLLVPLRICQLYGKSSILLLLFYIVILSYYIAIPKQLIVFSDFRFTK